MTVLMILNTNAVKHLYVTCAVWLFLCSIVIQILPGEKKFYTTQSTLTTATVDKTKRCSKYYTFFFCHMG